MLVNNLQANDCLLSRCFVPKNRVLFAPAFMLRYKRSASGSILGLHWYPFVGCQERQRQRDLVSSCLHPAAKGCSEHLAVGGQSPAYMPGSTELKCLLQHLQLPSKGCLWGRACSATWPMAQEKGEALLLRMGCRTQVHC